MFRLLTDFNEIDGDRVRGLEEDLQLVEELHQARSIQPGDRVLVHDGGEEAAGVVDRVENGLIYVLVDWSTFGPERRVHSGPHGVWWAATNDHIRMQDEGIAVTIDGVPAGDKTLA
jgi:hypothetical protein